MPNLVIDIGNTLTKVAVFENDHLLKAGQYQNPEETHIKGFLSEYKADRVIIASVKTTKQPWQMLLEATLPVTYFNSSIKAGINNLYKTPDTLGADRLAAVIGANYLYPDTNNIIISGGTCITYDYIDADANYFGGSISPGLNMRYKAVNHYTAALPFLEADKNFTAAYGDDTASAIRSGVQNGIKYELEGFIKEYIKTTQGYNIILSGGDSIFFDTLLKNSIFAPYIKIEPYLVLKGLNAAIQKHND
ncbi:type III pantothenate kinase [Mucilaginibacter phyllosphaerae]|uniref:Type III pantothenate kinase n=1 Tax=Mucilaginibacter phyllosphaerae TaxID=1812349 RepID=A0A4Y8A9X2_9SPHI|nr:type III pantothenate kinase [Mucilaginibacter phyllosphaerae]MBB3969854.1 type III pantothenate kinase [Mucilaginibacter phyllosphaerae]TEW65228.1 type III pantothenate kinase [Mucilaginibacter phyllosphaerae]GGH17160.1 type III pantothenate kinase [Mucilaginibacter phyllosphaerae]